VNARALGRCAMISVLLAAILSATAAAGQKDYAVIKVEHRLAEEVLPLVEPMLSPTGKALADRHTNSLVVVDTPEAIDRIRRFLAGSDSPGRPVTVRVRFGQTSSSGGYSAAVAGQISGDNARVRVGNRKTDGVSARLQGHQRRGRERSEYFVTVQSGGIAYIWAGKEVPYTQYWADTCRRYGGLAKTVTFKTVETGFDVQPVVTGNRAHIKITPRISSTAQDGRQQVVRFAEAATQVTAPLGQWVEIGGGSDSGGDVHHAILATGGSRRDSSLSIALRVDAQ
jgi:type II secretory pathway component HofQ